MGLKTREMGWSRAIVVAATGIGKTYLAAFDCREYKKVLFVAHREEILNQAAATFYSVRPDSSVGFFSDGKRDMDCDITFATVQTIGKKEYLCDEHFSKDAFDYIIVDEAVILGLN